MSFFDEVMGWQGKRVRYMSSGIGETCRINPHALSAVQVPVRIVVEGEVAGAQATTYGPVEVSIAGYGWVPASQCELIGDTPEFDPETGWADQDIVPLLQELLAGWQGMGSAFESREYFGSDAEDLERRIRVAIGQPRDDDE